MLKIKVMLKIAILSLLSLKGKCFLMDDEDKQATRKPLFSAGLDWARLTPAIVVSLPSQTEEIVNKTK
tara:strand:+ start:111 stop:314 length:204 start_codon:yes stop_codon:yes gene_type:complete